MGRGSGTGFLAFRGRETYVIKCRPFRYQFVIDQLYHCDMAHNNPQGGEISVPDLLALLQNGVDKISDVAGIVDHFEQLGIEFSEGEEITGGFVVVREGNREEFLQQHIGQPVMVTDWTFLDGEFGEYVEVRIVTRTGKYKIVDGSTGICKQLRTITDKRNAEPKQGMLPTAGLLVKNGFRTSGNYFFDERTKQAIPNNKLDTVPAEFRKPGKPVWYFAF